MNKGFFISLEAIISLFIFSLLLLSQISIQNEEYIDLIILQQENDLLKIWSKNFNQTEMIKDILFFDNACLFINNKKVHDCTFKKNCVSSEAEILDNELKLHSVKIITCYN